MTNRVTPTAAMAAVRAYTEGAPAIVAGLAAVLALVLVAVWYSTGVPALLWVLERRRSADPSTGSADWAVAAGVVDVSGPATLEVTVGDDHAAALAAAADRYGRSSIPVQLAPQGGSVVVRSGGLVCATVPPGPVADRIVTLAATSSSKAVHAVAEATGGRREPASLVVRVSDELFAALPA